MIAAVIAGVRNAGNGSTPPSISSRLPKVGSRFTFYVIGFTHWRDTQRAPGPSKPPARLKSYATLKSVAWRI